MLKFIINKPIITTIIIITLFELILQHHIIFFIFLVFIYVILKALGLTVFIKKSLRFLIKKSKEFFLYMVFKRYGYYFSSTSFNHNGIVSGFYIFDRKRKIYLADVIKTKYVVLIKLSNYLTGEIIEKKIRTTPFHIDRNSIIDFLEENYFNN